MSVELHTRLRRRLAALTHHADRIHDGDVEALHRTRVAARRLREFVPLLGLDAEAARDFQRRLKKLTRQLGTVRELDVSRSMLKAFERDRRFSTTALSQMNSSVEDAQRDARKRLAEKLPVAKVQRLANRLRRAVKRGRSEATRSVNGPSDAWIWALEAQVSRRADRTRCSIDNAGAVYAAQRLHDVRLSLKKLRYAAELLAQTRGLQASADLRALKVAQDLLGRLHDLEVLIERARREEMRVWTPSIPVWRDMSGFVSALHDDCRMLHAQYMRHRTQLRAIAERLVGRKVDLDSVDRRAVS